MAHRSVDRAKRAFMPCVGGCGSNEHRLESRSLAVFLLSQPNAGISSAAFSGRAFQPGPLTPPTDNEFKKDNSTSSMDASTGASWSTGDYDSVGTGNTVSEATTVSNSVSTGSNSAGSSGIGVAFSIGNQATSHTNFVGDGDVVTTGANLGTGADTSGQNPVRFNMVVPATGSPDTSLKTLHGELQITYVSSVSNNGNTTGNIAFNTTASGIAVAVNGGNLSITFPSNGTIYRQVTPNFFATTASNSATIDFSVNTTATTEAINYNAGATAAVPVDVDSADPQAQNTLSLSFSEYIN